MSASEHMKAALERFEVENSPKDSNTGSYELNGPERDREGEGDPSEHPSRSAESSTNSPSTA
jgi:hypothetical protein